MILHSKNGVEGNTVKKTVKEIVLELADVYSKKRVSRSAAAFSYFVTLSIFPTLICLYVMLGNILPSAETILQFANGIIPPDTLDIVLDFFEHIRSNQSPSMLVAGLVAMATTTAAAFRTLNSIMGDIQGKSRFQGFLSLVISFILSLVFLMVMYFAVIVIITGSWLITYLEDEIVDFINFSNSWRWVRFLLLFALLLVIVYGIYVITVPRRAKRSLLPGAVAASTAMVVVSMVFSWFIGMSARYPLVYGSLASIIILLIWLYIIGNILIMGNVLNVVLRKEDGDRNAIVKDEISYDPRSKLKTQYTAPARKK